MACQTQQGKLPFFVECYHKILLSFSMEMVCVPKAHHTLPHTVLKRQFINSSLVFDEEDSDNTWSKWPVPRQYLQPPRPKAATSTRKPNAIWDGEEWHQTGMTTHTA